MDITVGLVLLTLGLIFLAIGVFTRTKKTRPLTILGVIGIAIYFLSLFAPLPFVNTVVYSSTALAVSGGTVSTGGTTTYATYQPTATYATTNHFSSASVTGTSYYKAGSAKASTTAISNTDPSTTYQYWIDNETYYVNPKSFVGSGTKSIVNDQAYKNGTVTINGYDLINDRVITSGAYNTSLSTGTAKLKFTVLGSATTSAIPFGGALVVETNNTVSQINCFGDGISATPSTKYQVTYSPTATNTRFVIYEVASGYDVSPDGLVGVTKTFECDFVSSTDPGDQSHLYVKLIPANWYYVNSDGSFALDTEKKLNGDTTRTLKGLPTATFHWGA